MLFFLANCFVMIASPKLASGDLTDFEKEVNAAIERRLKWLENQELTPSDNYYYGKIALRALAFLEHGYLESEDEEKFKLPDNVGEDISSLEKFLGEGYQQNIDALQKRYLDEYDKNVKKYSSEKKLNPNKKFPTCHHRLIYEIACAIMALKKTNNPDYDDEIIRGLQFLVDAQNETNGGFGWRYYMTYTESQVDIINTHFAILALFLGKEIAKKDEKLAEKVDLALTRAIEFVSSLQSKESQNQVKYGGFAYSSRPKGYSKSRAEKVNESFLSGSLTAAGIWCLNLHDVKKEDQRISGAVKFLKDNYVNDYVSQNGHRYVPNPVILPSSKKSVSPWLYYYYWSLAKALDLTFNPPNLAFPEDPPAVPRNGPSEENWYYHFAKYLLKPNQNPESPEPKNRQSPKPEEYDSRIGGFNDKLLDTIFALYVLRETPDVSVDVSKIGDSAEYTVTVTNRGEIKKDSYNIEITDSNGIWLNQNGFSLSLTDKTPSIGELEIVRNPQNGNIETIRIKNLPAGQSKRLRLTINTPQNFTRQNFPNGVTFTVTATSMTEPEFANKDRITVPSRKKSFAKGEATIIPIPTEFDVEITPVDCVSLGGQFASTVTVTNEGEVNDSCKMDFELPANFRVVRVIDKDPSTPGRLVQIAGEYVIQDLPAKKSKKLELTMRAPISYSAPTLPVIKVTATSQTNTDVSDEDEVEFNVYDVSVDISTLPHCLQPDDKEAKFTITVTNKGTATNSYEMNFDLPKEFPVLEVTDNDSSTPGRLMEVEGEYVIQDLPAKKSKNLVLTSGTPGKVDNPDSPPFIKVKAISKICHKVAEDSSEFDLYDVSVTIDPSKKDCVRVGGNAVFNVMVENKGTVEDEYNIKVTGLPKGFGPPSGIPNKINLKAGKPGGNWTLTIPTPQNYTGPAPIKFKVVATSEPCPDVSGEDEAEFNLYDVSVTVEPEKVAIFKITEQSLENLKSEDVPDDVLGKLQRLKNREYTREEKFLDILKRTIGDEQTVRFAPLILKHAAKVKIKPCETAVFKVTVTNKAIVEDSYTITVTGLPEGFTHNIPSSTGVLAVGEFKILPLTITTDKNYNGHAPVTFTVTANSDICPNSFDSDEEEIQFKRVKFYFAPGLLFAWPLIPTPPKKLCLPPLDTPIYRIDRICPPPIDTPIYIPDLICLPPLDTPAYTVGQVCPPPIDTIIWGPPPPIYLPPIDTPVVIPGLICPPPLDTPIVVELCSAIDTPVFLHGKLCQTLDTPIFIIPDPPICLPPLDTPVYTIDQVCPPPIDTPIYRIDRICLPPIDTPIYIPDQVCLPPIDTPVYTIGQVCPPPIDTPIYRIDQICLPPIDTPIEIIAEHEAHPCEGGNCIEDDDGDGRMDEERYNHIDDDGDGLIDEDIECTEDAPFIHWVIVEEQPFDKDLIRIKTKVSDPNGLEDIKEVICVDKDGRKEADCQFRHIGDGIYISNQVERGEKREMWVTVEDNEGYCWTRRFIIPPPADEQQPPPVQIAQALKSVMPSQDLSNTHTQFGRLPGTSQSYLSWRYNYSPLGRISLYARTFQDEYIKGEQIATRRMSLAQDFIFSESQTGSFHLAMDNLSNSQTRFYYENQLSPTMSTRLSYSRFKSSPDTNPHPPLAPPKRGNSALSFDEMQQYSSQTADFALTGNSFDLQMGTMHSLREYSDFGRSYYANVVLRNQSVRNHSFSLDISGGITRWNNQMSANSVDAAISTKRMSIYSNLGLSMRTGIGYNQWDAAKYFGTFIRPSLYWKTQSDGFISLAPYLTIRRDIQENRGSKLHYNLLPQLRIVQTLGSSKSYALSFNLAVREPHNPSYNLLFSIAKVQGLPY